MINTIGMIDYTKRLIGSKFGKLEVIDFSGYSKGNKTRWLCKCECGNTKIVRNDCLQSLATQSCGCINKQIGSDSKSYKGYEDLALYFFNSMKNGAIRRNLEFSITIEDAWNLFLKQNKKCIYSGWDLLLPSSKKLEKTASLDRIDSSKGYTVDNIQWVHKDINVMKMNYSHEYFMKIVQAIAKNNAV